jgi:hypothetical protein
MPIAEKLSMPAAYGDTTTTLAWPDVRAQLVTAKQYWVAMIRPTGSPHVVPVDGLWVDDVLYYGGSPETLHVRIARAHPRVTIHLPDPWNVVVVEGAVHVVTPALDLAQHLADLANEKYPDYGIHFDASSYREPFAFRPTRALAWTQFPSNATRFVFDS